MRKIHMQGRAAHLASMNAEGFLRGLLMSGFGTWTDGQKRPDAAVRDPGNVQDGLVACTTMNNASIASKPSISTSNCSAFGCAFVYCRRPIALRRRDRPQLRRSRSIKSECGRRFSWLLEISRTRECKPTPTNNLDESFRARDVKNGTPAADPRWRVQASFYRLPGSAPLSKARLWDFAAQARDNFLRGCAGIPRSLKISPFASSMPANLVQRSRGLAFFRSAAWLLDLPEPSAAPLAAALACGMKNRKKSRIPIRIRNGSTRTDIGRDGPTGLGATQLSKGTIVWFQQLVGHIHQPSWRIVVNCGRLSADQDPFAVQHKKKPKKKKKQPPSTDRARPGQ